MIKQDFTYQSDWGWFDRRGRFYSCGHHEHTELAHQIFEQQGEYYDDPDGQAEQLGWVKVGRWSIDSSICVHAKRHLNDAQQYALEQWMIAHNLVKDDLLWE